MFFPFVGLVIAIVWTAACWLYRHPLPRTAVATVAAVILAAGVWGTWQRNRVWHSEESLWYDVTLKSPKNGRGLMTYGNSQVAKGEYLKALDYYKKRWFTNRPIPRSKKISGW